ncbi:MAG TPA: hypothetical protein VEH31_41940 [Streptosporangiaceae bacterium]|nr:hypothetical protein [Streptosporangiaceae bacterium]
MLVAVVIGVTVPEFGLETYKVFPSGVIAFAPRTERLCTLPTWIGLPGVLVAVAIGVTVVPPMTYAVFPSGVIAIVWGDSPTLIGLPAVLVAMVIGVTVP